MKKLKAEWILVVVGLLVIAATILSETHYTPDRQASAKVSHTLTQTATSEKSHYTVNINEASVDELFGIKYMTRNIAEGIVDYRKENGRFTSEEELLNVNGIGSVMLERFHPYISLE